MGLGRNHLLNVPVEPGPRPGVALLNLLILAPSPWLATIVDHCWTRFRHGRGLNASRLNHAGAGAFMAWVDVSDLSGEASGGLYHRPRSGLARACPGQPTGWPASLQPSPAAATGVCLRGCPKGGSPVRGGPVDLRHSRPAPPRSNRLGSPPGSLVFMDPAELPLRVWGRAPPS